MAEKNQELEVVDVEAGEVIGDDNLSSKQSPDSRLKYGKLPSGKSSMFDQRDSQDLEWSNLNFTVKKTNKILHNVAGKVLSKQVCAIMGPSGSGKSSLLNILAGRSASAHGIDVNGDVKVNGNKIDPVDFRKNIAYVMQDDGLMPTATPLEAIKFSALLRLEPNEQGNIDELVNQTLKALGLQDCCNTYIGGGLLKGISGGQRKRVSVGVELVTKPSIILLDEPTSGLDSFTAYSLVKLLKKIALSNATIVCTIHQPSSEVFHLFDTCIFLKEGRVFYAGNVVDVVPTLAGYQLNCPSNYNPADYAMFIIQTETFEDLEEKGMKFIKDKEEVVSEANSAGPDHMVPAVKAPWYRQVYLLASREATNTLRNKPAIIGRFAITIILNLIYGMIYLNAGDRDDTDMDNFQGHYGATTVIGISAMFGAANPALLQFPTERPMFMREYSSGMYTSWAYFLSKVVNELPITFTQNLVQIIVTYWMIGFKGNFIFFVLSGWGIGCAATSLAVLIACLVKDPKTAIEMSPLLLVPQLMFAGFFIRLELIPVWLRWAQYLCGLKYGMNLLLLTEFGSPTCQDGAEENCHSILARNDIKQEHWYVYVIILAGMFLLLRAAAAISLSRMSVRFY